MQTTPTTKEIEERLQRKRDFIDKELPFVLKERDYEVAKAEIRKAQFEQVRYMLELGQLTASQKEQAKEGEKNEQA